MKKKVFILIGLIAMGLCIWEAKASNPQNVLINFEKEDNHIPSGAEKIELRGKLSFNADPDDIEAGATENAVYIYFNQNFGNVNISLYNNATDSLIYGSVVDTSTQQLVVIPISNITSGTYTVVLNNANGYAEGDFER